MIDKISTTSVIIPFITTTLLENGVGVIIDRSIPHDCICSINIDEYYHKYVVHTPEIADLLIIIKSQMHKSTFSLYIVEMKNINSPKYFKICNIYNKFKTVIDDFLKIRHQDIFEDSSKIVIGFRLYFISDAYRLLKRGFTETQIRSFLASTKIEILQSLPPFSFRHFKAYIEYKLPNPLIT